MGGRPRAAGPSARRVPSDPARSQRAPLSSTPRKDFSVYPTTLRRRGPAIAPLESPFHSRSNGVRHAVGDPVGLLPAPFERGESYGRSLLPGPAGRPKGPSLTSDALSAAELRPRRSELRAAGVLVSGVFDGPRGTRVYNWRAGSTGWTGRRPGRGSKSKARSPPLSPSRRREASPGPPLGEKGKEDERRPPGCWGRGRGRGGAGGGDGSGPRGASTGGRSLPLFR
eukprot:tig00000178_g12799.t1